MSDNVLQILFLGESPSWLKLSQAILEAPDVPLQVHRAQSPSDAFRVLSRQKWDALAIDLHAWSFQGLLSLQKIRSEYQAMPLIALVYPAVKDLEKRALESGASRCLTLDKLTASANCMGRSNRLSWKGKRSSRTIKGSKKRNFQGLCRTSLLCRGTRSNSLRTP